MKKYLATLAEDQAQRSSEEYLGAFTESLKLIQHENPVERTGNAVLLAAKTALRLKAVMPKLKEHEIAHRLQTIARSIRLMNILKDVTPEERSMLKWSDHERALKARGVKRLSDDSAESKASRRVLSRASRRRSAH